MFCLKVRRLRHIGRPPHGLRCCQTLAIENEEHVNLLMNLLETPNSKEIRQAIKDNSKIISIKSDVIKNSFEQLRSFNIETSDIRAEPKILIKHALTITNNYKVLLEAGFTKVGVKEINHYVRIVNKPIDQLKSLQLIPQQTNVGHRLSKFIRMDASNMEFKDTERLKDIRMRLVYEYLFQNFGVSDVECQRIWKAYTNIRHKSLESMCTAVELLQSELGMSKERIIKHPYLLYCDPENIRNILNEPTLSGMNTRELMWRRPKILMSSHKALMKVQQHLRDFKIPDSAVPRCIEVFTLSPDTIYERLTEMRKDKEFSVLVDHPRVLRLVHYHSKARARLQYLHKMNVNCVSLQVLSGCSEHFEKYTRTGVDRTNGGDIVLYLSKVLDRSVVQLRTTLKRHPNWCHVPVPTVKQTLEFLVREGFSLKCINDNIFLILYPITRIEKQLLALRNNGLKYDVAGADISANQTLQLCLYLIEKEFHFAGDGIWLHPLQTSEYTGSVVPETEAQMLGNYKSSTVRGSKRVVFEEKTTFECESIAS